MPKYNKKGKYKTVVIDPPWPITSNVGSLKKYARPEKRHKPIYQRPLNKPYYYDSMTIEEILEFPVNEFAHDESLLFVWCTNGRTSCKVSTMKTALELLEMNGYNQFSIITWNKPQGTAVFSPIINMTEHCIVGYRGNYNNLINKQYAVMKSRFRTERQITHSEKPTKFYQMLRAWTPEPRIDLFARQRHYGFDGWGDEYVGDGPLSEWLE